MYKLPIYRINKPPDALRFSQPTKMTSTQDPTSQSNHLQLESVHIDFKWAIDYAKKIISGEATHTLLVKDDNVKEAV